MALAASMAGAWVVATCSSTSRAAASQRSEAVTRAVLLSSGSVAVVPRWCAGRGTANGRRAGAPGRGPRRRRATSVRDAPRQQRRGVARHAQELALARGQDDRFDGLRGPRPRRAHSRCRRISYSERCSRSASARPGKSASRRCAVSRTMGSPLPLRSRSMSDERVAGQAGQVAGQLSAGLDDLHADDAGADGHAVLAHGLADGEGARDGQLQARPGHERAAALVTADEAARLELAERLAEGGAGDVEVAAELALRGQSLALLPGAGGDERLGPARHQRVERLPGHDHHLHAAESSRMV